MRNILFILLISLTSCVVPQHIDSKECCDKRACYEPYYSPTRVIVVNKNKSTYTKRKVKVKVNKYRKRK